MRVTSFGSGSSGNAFLIETAQARLLLDAGLPIRTLQSGFRARGITANDLTAVLISHEHHDHVCSLDRLMRDCDVPCLATAGTVAALAGKQRREWQVLQPENAIRFSELSVTAISVAHDAADPAGFLIEDDSVRVAIFTDLGSIPSGFDEVLRGSQLVVLEANYDDDMLANGRYPAHLKRRVAGTHGHLSNRECASTLARALDHETSDVWLAHLSQNNNRPSLALAAVQAEIGQSSNGPSVTALPRRAAPVSWDATTAHSRPRQTTLPLF